MPVTFKKNKLKHEETRRIAIANFIDCKLCCRKVMIRFLDHTVCYVALPWEAALHVTVRLPVRLYVCLSRAQCPPLTRKQKTIYFQGEVTHIRSNWHSNFEVKRLKAKVTGERRNLAAWTLMTNTESAVR